MNSPLFVHMWKKILNASCVFFLLLCFVSFPSGKHSKGLFTYDDSYLSTCLVYQIMTKSGHSTYVVTKIMMYDVLLQIMKTFPYNDSKFTVISWKKTSMNLFMVRNTQSLDSKWSLLHPDFIENLYPFMMLWWFIRYLVTQIMTFYDRAGTWS